MMPAFTCDDCIKTSCVFRREAFWCKSIEVASDNLKETDPSQACGGRKIKENGLEAGNAASLPSCASGPMSSVEVP